MGKVAVAVLAGLLVIGVIQCERAQRRMAAPEECGAGGVLDPIGLCE